jgi:hypothetical protein
MIINSLITRALRLIISVSILILSFPAFSADKEDGGKGTIESTVVNQCFTPESSIVKQVCTQYKIYWKLWSLMGEPVGNYHLSWTLQSITLADPQGKSNRTYTTHSLPGGLAKSVDAIELYLDGYSQADGFCPVGKTCGVVHRFNTGVAVRAGVRSSYNVPGSPNWDKLFVDSRGACEDKTSIYQDAAEARKSFVKGIKLSDFTPCPGSSVTGVASLESAVRKLCEAPIADEKYPFCPKQKPEKEKVTKGNAIDDAFSQMEAQTGRKPVAKTGNVGDEFAKMEAERAEQERIRLAALKAKQEKEARELAQRLRHDEAVKYCTAAIKSDSDCLKKTCKREPPKTTCIRGHFEDIPCNPAPGTVCMMLSKRVCDEEGPNPDYVEWKSCANGPGKVCTQNSTKYANVDECVRSRE